MAGNSKLAVKNQAQGELFLVATPIGNLGDITLRALETLKNVSLVACEDTRTSRVLMQHYGIDTPLTAYHAHNEAAATAQLLGKLMAGAHIAVISDAGTPLLSDPGARLVGAAIEAGIRVTPLPGASALLSALTISGLPALPFYFAGFLPPKQKARRDAFSALKSMQATLVFYESPKRLAESLVDAQLVLGDRSAAVGRELTKLYEECRRGPLSLLAAHFDTAPSRGECVLMIDGAGEAAPLTADETDALLTRLLASHSVKETAALAAAETGQTKRDLYARAIVLSHGE